MNICFVDSLESFRKESAILFPEFDVDEWYREEELDFRSGNIAFDDENFLHRIISNVQVPLTSVHK